MHDFDYDCLQRKRIAQQARHKKNGSKSKKCTLPSDRLTPKQWKERNGEVMTYNLREPMDWATFKALPADIQAEYLKKLANEHCGTLRSISEMFGISHFTLSKHISSRGLPVKFEKKRRSAESIEKWKDFTAVMLRDTPAPEQEDEAPWPDPEIAPEAEPEEIATYRPEQNRPVYGLGEWGKAAMRFDSFTLNFSGPFDREALINSLSAILHTGQRVKLEIKCEMEGD